MDALPDYQGIDGMHSKEKRYAVYFSHGDKFEVMASSEAEAKARA
jgi:hypothetical protein